MDTNELEVRIQALEARLTAAEAALSLTLTVSGLAKLLVDAGSKHVDEVKVKKTRKIHEYTPEEKAAIRSRFLKGQADAKAKREAESASKAEEKTAVFTAFAPKSKPIGKTQGK